MRATYLVIRWSNTSTADSVSPLFLFVLASFFIVLFNKFINSTLRR